MAATTELVNEYQDAPEHQALWRFGAASAEFARRPSALAYRALVEAMDRYQNACNAPSDRAAAIIAAAAGHQEDDDGLGNP